MTKQNAKCVNCGERKRCRESTASLVFFVIGMIAIIAVRAVTILAHIEPFYGQAAWYIGIIGFILYFSYKYDIDKKRSAAIVNNGLIGKMLHGQAIEKEDREMIGAMLCAITSRKDRLNYLLIFLSSAVVLVIAFYMDFIKK